MDIKIPWNVGGGNIVIGIAGDTIKVSSDSISQSVAPREQIIHVVSHDRSISVPLTVSQIGARVILRDSESVILRDSENNILTSNK